MSTVTETMRERTHRMIDDIPERQVQQVFSFIIGLMAEGGENSFKPLSENAFFESLDRSLEQADRGEGQDAIEALREIEKELESA